MRKNEMYKSIRVRLNLPERDQLFFNGEEIMAIMSKLKGPKSLHKSPVHALMPTLNWWHNQNTVSTHPSTKNLRELYERICCKKVNIFTVIDDMDPALAIKITSMEMRGNTIIIEFDEETFI